MKFETITIKNPKTHKNMNVVLKHDKTDKLLCSCNGTYTKASDCNAFVFDEENRTLKCPECGKELEIIERIRISFYCYYIFTFDNKASI